MNKSLKYGGRAFVVGSSLVATILTFLYVGHAWQQKHGKHDDDAFRYEVFAIGLPLVFGIVNALVQSKALTKAVGGSYYVKMAIVGALVGIGLSYYGNFYVDLPKDLFGMSKDKRKNTLVFTPIVYALVWGLLIASLNKFMKVAA
jgi:hypothetical protein